MYKLHISNTRTKTDDFLTFTKKLLLLVCVSSGISIILLTGILGN